MSTTFVLFGIPISDSVVVGRAHLLSHATLEVGHYHILNELVGEEQDRLSEAVQRLTQELSDIQTQAHDHYPQEVAAMINVQRMILNDPMLVAAAQTHIAREQCNAEWALVSEMEHLVEQFEQFDNAYLAERKYDIMQITERILQHMQGSSFTDSVKSSHAAAKDEPVIIVAHDLSPGELMQMRHTATAAFITDIGGLNSHTSIMARSQELPAVLGLRHARRLIQESEWLIIDGLLGMVIVNPDATTLTEYYGRVAEWRLQKDRLNRLVKVPAITLDHIPVELQANIETPDDVESVLKYNAAGIGLFRSEFLFLGNSTLPDEETQFKSYKRVLQSMGDTPVTIRTLDIGTDKMPQAFNKANISSPLGLRAIRLCLSYPKMFRVQLRALLRASAFGQLKILLPMITDEAELLETINLLEQTKKELTKEKIPYCHNIPLGIMLEVPATIFILPHIANHIQFVSLGTNDLTQYSLAVDRTDATVNYLYNSMHPGVLHLIQHCVQWSQRNHMPISVCGEIGGNPRFTRFLLSMGLRSFSMNTSQLLAVKQQIVGVSIVDLQKKAKSWKSGNAEKIKKVIDQLNL